MENKKVSCIMAVYNREKYLAEAIESTLNQSYKNIELVIVNDASLDNSHSICEFYQKNYPGIVKYIHLNTNGGAGNSFNTGVQNAGGDYIAFVASDDIQHRDRIKNCLDELERESGLDMVFCNYETIDAKSNRTGRKLIIPPEINNDNLLNFQLRRNYMFSGLCLMKNTRDIKFDISLRHSEDYDLFLKLVYNGYKAKFIDQALEFYRIHDENISANYAKTADAVQYILNKYNSDDLLQQLRQRGTAEKTAHITLGIMNISKKDYSTAIEYLQQAVEYPAQSLQDDIDNWFYLATAYFFSGHLQKSKESLYKVEEICRGEPTILNNLGLLEWLVGDKEKALYYFNEALALEPLYKDAKRNIDSIKEGVPPQLFTQKFLRKNVVHI